MFCELVRQGRKVGITAISHKVIQNLILEVIQAANEAGLKAQNCIQKVKRNRTPHRPALRKRKITLRPVRLFAAMRRSSLALPGFGRNQNVSKRWTFFSLTRPDKCRWQMCWLSLKRQKTLFCSATLSNWSSR